VPGAGHLWTVTHPQLFADVMRAWLGTRTIAPGLHELPAGASSRCRRNG
jgi:hypothetical protein